MRLSQSPGCVPHLCKISEKKEGRKGRRGKEEREAKQQPIHPWQVAALELVAGTNLPLLSGSGGRSDRELLLRPIWKGSGSSDLRGCEGMGSG